MTYDPTTVPGVIARWKSADLSALADGAAVSSWSDETANAYTLSQGTASQQPLKQTVTANGKTYPVVRFDGVDDHLNSPSANTITVSAYTVFVVLTKNTSAGSTTFAAAAGYARAGGTGWAAKFKGDAPEFETTGTSAAGYIDGTAVTIGTPYVGTIGHDGTTGSGWLNGTLIATAANAYTASAGRVIVGAITTNAGYPFPGDVAEVLFYNRSLTAAERAQVHSYLQDTYGITVSDYTASGSSFTGTASLSGAGTLTATGAPAASTTASLSGAGTLTATGKPTVTAAAALSGSGTLTASGSVTGSSASGTATFSGTGTLTASGTAALTATAQLSGLGTLAALGVPTITATAPLSGTGTLTASGVNPSTFRDITIAVGRPYTAWTAGPPSTAWRAGPVTT